VPSYKDLLKKKTIKRPNKTMMQMSWILVSLKPNKMLKIVKGSAIIIKKSLQG